MQLPLSSSLSSSSSSLAKSKVGSIVQRQVSASKSASSQNKRKKPNLVADDDDDDEDDHHLDHHTHASDDDDDDDDQGDVLTLAQARKRRKQLQQQQKQRPSLSSSSSSSSSSANTTPCYAVPPSPHTLPTPSPLPTLSYARSRPHLDQQVSAVKALSAAEGVSDDPGPLIDLADSDDDDDDDGETHQEGRDERFDHHHHGGDEDDDLGDMVGEGDVFFGLSTHERRRFFEAIMRWGVYNFDWNEFHSTPSPLPLSFSLIVCRFVVFVFSKNYTVSSSPNSSLNLLQLVIDYFPFIIVFFPLLYFCRSFVGSLFASSRRGGFGFIRTAVHTLPHAHP